MLNSQRIYIACGDYDFSWRPEQVKSVISSWEEGLPLPEIAAKFKPRQEEALLLLVDMAARRRIKARPGGILGEGW
jgi:hypothetical protein